jgi:hypothetical protein
MSHECEGCDDCKRKELFNAGRKAGLEEAVKIAEGLVYDLGVDVPFWKFAEAICRLTQGTDK